MLFDFIIWFTVVFTSFIHSFILFYFHTSHLGTYHGNGKRHIQYTSSDNLHDTHLDDDLLTETFCIDHPFK